MASDFKIKDPVVFGETVFGCDLWSKQKQILHAIECERRVAVKACHSSGKTFTAALAALWFACRHRNARVLTLAPGWLTTRAVIWASIHSLLQRAKYRLPTTVLNQTEIRLGPDNLVIGLSTADATRLQGHHAEHLLVIADESIGIDADFWPALEGNLAGGDSHLLILGNPTQSGGYFYDAFGRNRANWKNFTISAFDTPNLEGLTLETLLALPDQALDDNACSYLTTRRWVRDRYKEWFNGSPEESPLWQSRVLGEFPSASSNALIPLSLLESARQPPSDPGADVTIGIDPAGPGRDKTVAVACAGGAILETAVWTNADARGPAVQFARKWSERLTLVRVDSIGIGFFFAAHIRDAGYRTQGINVASAADDREKFANLKAERYWALRQRFQRGEVSGLSDDALAELAATTYLIDSAGRIAIEPKHDVKAVLGRSPDVAEALMIAIGDIAPGRMEFTLAPRPPRRGAFDVAPRDSSSVTGDEWARRMDAEDARYRLRAARWGRGWQKY